MLTHAPQPTFDFQHLPRLRKLRLAAVILFCPEMHTVPSILHPPHTPPPIHMHNSCINPSLSCSNPPHFLNLSHTAIILLCPHMNQVTCFHRTQPLSHTPPMRMHLCVQHVLMLLIGAPQPTFVFQHLPHLRHLRLAAVILHCPRCTTSPNPPALPLPPQPPLLMHSVVSSVPGGQPCSLLLQLHRWVHAFSTPAIAHGNHPNPPVSVSTLATCTSCVSLQSSWPALS